VPGRTAEGAVLVRVGAERVALELLDELTARAQAVAGAGSVRGSGDVKAAIPGRVLRLLVAPGDEVQRGQPVVVLEAMKMENDVRARATASSPPSRSPPGSPSAPGSSSCASRRPAEPAGVRHALRYHPSRMPVRRLRPVGTARRALRPAACRPTARLDRGGSSVS
jgi:biotin carboxyl carrier protein